MGSNLVTDRKQPLLTDLSSWDHSIRTNYSKIPQMPIFSNKFWKTISQNSEELGFKIIGKSQSYRRRREKTFLILYTYPTFFISEKAWVLGKYASPPVNPPNYLLVQWIAIKRSLQIRNPKQIHSISSNKVSDDVVYNTCTSLTRGVFLLEKSNGGPARGHKRLSACAPLRRPGVRWFGSRARTDAPLVKPCCGGVPYKVEEDGHGC